MTKLSKYSARYKVVEAAPASAGKTCLLKHLDGKRLTFRQAVIAKCAECMGYYRDGRVDCGVETCPLYPTMPYRRREGSDSDKSRPTMPVIGPEPPDFGGFSDINDGTRVITPDPKKLSTGIRGRGIETRRSPYKSTTAGSSKAIKQAEVMKYGFKEK